MSAADARVRVVGLGGRLVGTVFFLVFLGMGLLFCGLLGREVYQVAQTYAWTKVECVILESKVVEQRDSRETPYRFAVKYQYAWEGRNRVSETYARQRPAFSEYNKAARLVARFPVDTKTTCWVNPRDPSESTLARQGLWMGLFIVIPLIFVAVGAGAIYWLWRVGPTRSVAAALASAAISSRAKQAKAPVLLVFFFFIFFAAGCAAFYGLGLRPAFKILTARGWVERPCVVLSSQVQHHSDSDGTTYRIDILYRYEFNGEEHKSSRYHFMGGSTSGYRGKAEIVRRYPRGKKAVCYVNPADPTEAVLERGFTPDMAFGLLPLIFVAVGGGGMWFTWRHVRKQSHPEEPSRSPSVRSGSGPAVLKARMSRLTAFFGSLLFAAFWNGIVSVFVGQAIESWRRGHPQWGLTLFLIPFVAVGLGFIGYVGYSFLGLFNPRVRLTVDHLAVPLGSRLDVGWEIRGRTSVLSRLRIYLEGREEVIYRRGKNSRTEKHVFATHDLATLTNRQDMRSGRARLTISAHTMHTFESGHSKILWAIQVQGEIARWPDIKDEFPITLLPLPVGQIPTS